MSDAQSVHIVASTLSLRGSRSTSMLGDSHDDGDAKAASTPGKKSSLTTPTKAATHRESWSEEEDASEAEYCGRDFCYPASPATPAERSYRSGPAGTAAGGRTRTETPFRTGRTSSYTSSIGYDVCPSSDMSALSDFSSSYPDTLASSESGRSKRRSVASASSGDDVFISASERISYATARTPSPTSTQYTTVMQVPSSSSSGGELLYAFHAVSYGRASAFDPQDADAVESVDLIVPEDPTMSHSATQRLRFAAFQLFRRFLLLSFHLPQRQAAFVDGIIWHHPKSSGFDELGVVCPSTKFTPITPASMIEEESEPELWLSPSLSRTASVVSPSSTSEESQQPEPWLSPTGSRTASIVSPSSTSEESQQPEPWLSPTGSRTASIVSPSSTSEESEEPEPWLGPPQSRTTSVLSPSSASMISVMSFTEIESVSEVSWVTPGLTTETETPSGTDMYRPLTISVSEGAESLPPTSAATASTITLTASVGSVSPTSTATASVMSVSIASVSSLPTPSEASAHASVVSISKTSTPTIQPITPKSSSRASTTSYDETTGLYSSSVLHPSPSTQSIARQDPFDTSFDSSFLRPSGSMEDTLERQ
ncbi:hypothetical protein M422DRAFT_276632 [Sphaerobolus stellatus SS14]|uniref:Uncharacterized protein n=1 Tax=Sphaerobolus stellatus (strain SS14) TaxID=990650 RepID=A0A0C9T294_SPHS4|nr:hypothetical protein M422DRAFT_276632 [Sphaerobolus stellatus SS14]